MAKTLIEKLLSKTAEGRKALREAELEEVKPYRMWALFNYSRAPIFVSLTRKGCVEQGIAWVGADHLKTSRRNGSITIEKVIVRRLDRTAKP